MRFGMVMAGLVVASSIAASAYAAPVANGTVSSVALFNPTVDLSTDPSSYSALSGTTFQIAGTGGFAGIAGPNGTLNGTLLFSNTVGTTVNQSLTDFFVFSDTRGGTYNFSASSVRTNSFVKTTSSASSTLFVLGNIVNASKGLSSAPASLTIQFNRTGGSLYSSALSLATPPAGAVPETATWGMMLIGFGAVGGALRKRRGKVNTSVAFS